MLINSPISTNRTEMTFSDLSCSAYRGISVKLITPFSDGEDDSIAAMFLSLSGADYKLET